MSYETYYGNIIWTNHAIERLQNRGLDQNLAWEAFQHPDKKINGKKKGTIELQKKLEKSLITLIATQNEKREWVIISAWIDPPLPGSLDAKKHEDYKKYQKASFWGKFVLTLKKQLGI